MGSDPAEVTELLARWRAGDSEVEEELFPRVYAELRGIARRHLQRERVDHTLQATALVNEAYLRLIDQTRVQWNDRAHFFAIASRMMRRVLVDHARRRNAARRGKGALNVTFNDGFQPGAGSADVDLIDLDRALDALSELDPRQAEIVELRSFGGLTVEETAEVTGLSSTTVKREWAAARAWLYRELSGD